MSGMLVTRGLTGSATSMIARGLIPSTIRAVIKGGGRFIKRAIAEVEDQLKISINLISMNGKELSEPIFNKVSKLFKSNHDIVLSVFPKTLTVRKSRKIKVTATLRKDEK
tara:strand:- start:807 stop:1136 length:330 start_codon:yes stop_codon:yes gene_type:complete